MNFARLGYVSERAQVGEHHEAILAVTIPERPGAFLEFCSAIGERSITEFNYRLSRAPRRTSSSGSRSAGATRPRRSRASSRSHGYACLDLSEDDLAKTHVRHMVGGRAPDVQDEVLYTFEFPERPGALLQFLSGLGARWNISLFHYRNHGAAFGRVLCGLEVPVRERRELVERLKGLGFGYVDETEQRGGAALPALNRAARENRGAIEGPPAMTRICVVAKLPRRELETFIAAHVERLPAEVLLHRGGGAFPLFAQTAASEGDGASLLAAGASDDDPTLHAEL
jgi:hypothetical protein